VEAFATAADLAARLKREFTPDEEEWIDTLLEDASAYLRGVIGQDVFPRTTSTFVGYPSAGRVDLPQFPVVSVDAVERDDEEIDHSFWGSHIVVARDIPVDVTFTWGYQDAPDELKRLACSLVSAALLPLEAGLGLTAGGLSSVQLDDFKLAWADGGASSGMALPEIQQDSLRRQFGRGDVYVLETGR
jgi:hypothetical protein